MNQYDILIIMKTDVHVIGPGHIASTDGYAYKLLFLIFVTLSYIMLQRDIAVGGALSTSVRPSVCLSVCHTLVLTLNSRLQHHAVFTTGLRDSSF